MKLTLRILGLMGLLLFGSLFGLTFGVPEQLEQSAKGFIKQQLTQEVQQKLAPVTDHALVKKAQQWADRLGFQESILKQDLADQLPQKIAEVVARLCGYDCEKKKQLAADIRDSYVERIKSLQLGQHNLTALIKGQYLEIVGQLRLDLRIFTFSNALMFLLMLLISLFKPQAIKHLYVPGCLLFAATLTATCIYLFGQNWFYTIIYNDYMGWAYLVYLSLIYGFFMDIALNQCRITSEVFNAIGHAFGDALGSVSPC